MPTLLSDMHVEYLVQENGQPTGVVLSIEDYHMLKSILNGDPDLLVGLDVETLSAIAAGMLTVQHQQHLSELLEQNRTTGLAPKEQFELDRLLGDIDRLNLLKARATYTLKQSDIRTK